VSVLAVSARRVRSVADCMIDVERASSDVREAENAWACSSDRIVKFDARVEMAAALTRLLEATQLAIDAANIEKADRP
jgi:hypothetical protein